MFYKINPCSNLFPTFGFRIITELSSLEDLPELKLTSYLTNGLTITRFEEIANDSFNSFCGSRLQP